MPIDVIIVGAGPAGLACATSLASQGLSTLVLERNLSIGKKVCAGGVTWNGLVKRVPENLFERTFPVQHIITPAQDASVSASSPIIATLNRQALGQHMAKEALQAGAEIKTGCLVRSIEKDEVTYFDKGDGALRRKRFRYLVGADGSSSLIRRYLGIPATDMGVGINYQLPGHYSEMQWHLDSKLFGSGYGWVFPHRSTVSIGAYVDNRVMKAKTLKDNLLQWAKKFKYPLTGIKGHAEYINFDYRGHRFNNIFLIGDAAGLASALTGEGIYPAIVSGEAIANIISTKDHASKPLDRLIKNHKRHKSMVTFTGKSPLFSLFLGELVTFCLKKKLVDFSAAEMAR